MSFNGSNNSLTANKVTNILRKVCSVYFSKFISLRNFAITLEIFTDSIVGALFCTARKKKGMRHIYWT